MQDGQHYWKTITSLSTHPDRLMVMQTCIEKMLAEHYAAIVINEARSLTSTDEDSEYLELLHGYVESLDTVPNHAFQFSKSSKKPGRSLNSWLGGVKSSFWRQDLLETTNGDNIWQLWQRLLEEFDITTLQIAEWFAGRSIEQSDPDSPFFIPPHPAYFEANLQEINEMQFHMDHVQKVAHTLLTWELNSNEGLDNVA